MDESKSFQGESERRKGTESEECTGKPQKRTRYRPRAQQACVGVLQRGSVVKETGIINIFSLLFALAPFIFSLIVSFVACNCSIRRNISV